MAELRLVFACAIVAGVAGVASCGSGGSSGTMPDGGGVGGSGGGDAATVRHRLQAAVSECKAGGRIRYGIDGSTAETLSLDGDFAEGAAVVLEAVPDPQSVFRGWTGDCAGTAPCSLSLDAPKTVGADFAPKVTNVTGKEFSVGESYASVGALTLDVSGALGAVIHFNDQADLGGGNVLSSPSGRALVVFETDGSVRWSRLWAANEWEIDALRWVNGDLIAVGTRLKTLDLDGFQLDGTYHDAMFVELDGASGQVENAVNATPQTTEEVHLASIAADGRIVVLGELGAVVNVGGTDLTPDPNSTTNEWVASFAPDFSHQWSLAISGENTFSESRAIDIHSSGTVAIGGSVQERLSVLGKTLTNEPTSESPFLVLVSAAGTLIDAKVFPVPGGSNQTDAVRFADDGDVITAMDVGATVDLGGGPLEPVGNTASDNDLVLGRFAPDASLTWQRRFATSGSEREFRIAMNGGTIHVLGKFHDNNDDIDFGTGLVHSAGYDVLATAHDAANGDIQWVRRFGCSDTDDPLSVAAAGPTTCLTGNFAGELDYGGAAPLSHPVDFGALICFEP